MLKFRSSPFEDDIEKATHENNLGEDWSLIMHICDNATNFQDGAKYCLKAIMKRLYHNVPRVVLQTLTLLDACVKNCDRRFLLQVASSEFTNEVRKLLPKMHPSTSNKLKELLQRWSLEDFKDDPELCIIPSLYYKLKSEAFEFPPYEKETKKAPVLCTNPDGVNSQEEENDIIKAIEISLKDTGRYEVPVEYGVAASSSKSLPEPFKVRTLYDFDAAEDNELTIKTGEIVLVLENSNANWWKGSNHRGEGLFPSNFVTEDLDFKSEEPEKPETISKTEIAPEVLEEEVKLDEAKIEKLIKWLNDTDPTEEITDPEELLLLEKQCCSMAPIIEENLQTIDNRLAMLNLVNEKIMAAFDLFHSLSDHMNMLNQPLKYYAGTLNQHIVQFPHPQVTILPGASLHQVTQPSVPPELMHVPATIPQTSNQVSSLSTTTVQSTSVSNVPEELPMPSNSNVNPTSLQGAVGISQPTNSTTSPTSSTSTTTSLPFCQPINYNVVGSYCVPSQVIPYPVQCGLNMQQPGYVQTPTSVAGVMPVPYNIPNMRPYFPFQYYYVNSNLPQQGVAESTSTTVTTQESEQKPVLSTTAPEVSIANISIPAASNYSNDLHNLYFNTSSTSDNQAEKQDIHAEVKSVNDKQVVCKTNESELILKKNL